jgi:hypothetical protein
MFDLSARSLVWIPVKWKGLRQANPDEVAEETQFEIEVLADLLPTNELAEVFVRDLDETATDEQREASARAAKLTELDRFKRLVTDWRRVKVGSRDAEFNDANIKALLSKPMFPMGFEFSYLNALAGRVEQAEKNSEGSSASGQPVAGGQSRTPGKRKRRGS